MPNKKKKIGVQITALMLFIAAGACLVWAFKEPPAEVVAAAKLEKMQAFRNAIAQKIGPSLLAGEFIKQIEIPTDLEEGEKSQKVNLEYTIDPMLQKSAEKLLKSYKPDYGAIVMLEAATGKILALVSFDRKSETSSNLALRGTFPAASIFKIVTATAALDKYDVTPDTIVMFNGGNHTLYKKNVMSDKVNRWTREITLREAFARSINTVFGRLTLEKLSPKDLEDYAIRFGFNKDIKSDLPFDSGFTEIPKEKNFHLTELASGYNRVTRMSPMQGALIASAIAQDGVMHVPYIVEKARDEQGNTIFQSEPIEEGKTMSAKGAEKLKELMEATITSGTSKKSFRNLVRDRHFKELVIGGKTGSLTGDNPKGKVDWFVGYAMNENQRIAIAALTVNVNYWTVKSSYLAQSLFRAHFKDQFSKNNEKFFNASLDSPEQKAGL